MELEDLEGGQDFPFCNPLPTQRDPPAVTNNYPHLWFSTCFPLLPEISPARSHFAVYPNFAFSDCGSVMTDPHHRYRPLKTPHCLTFSADYASWRILVLVLSRKTTTTQLQRPNTTRVDRASWQFFLKRYSFLSVPFSKYLRKFLTCSMSKSPILLILFYFLYYFLLLFCIISSFISCYFFLALLRVIL